MISNDALNTPQQTVLDCVRNLAQPLPRSTLAKLLAGSTSTRVDSLKECLFFGRLAHLQRKSILHYIDTLLQQQFLTLDSHQNVILNTPK